MRRQRRAAIRKHHMQADTKVGQRMCQADCIIRGGGAHHQAGGGQYAGARRMLNGIVDGNVQTEIIGGDD